MGLGHSCMGRGKLGRVQRVEEGAQGHHFRFFQGGKLNYMCLFSYFSAVQDYYFVKTLTFQKIRGGGANAPNDVPEGAGRIEEKDKYIALAQKEALWGSGAGSRGGREYMEFPHFAKSLKIVVHVIQPEILAWIYRVALKSGTLLCKH